MGVVWQCVERIGDASRGDVFFSSRRWATFIAEIAAGMQRLSTAMTTTGGDLRRFYRHRAGEVCLADAVDR